MNYNKEDGTDEDTSTKTNYFWKYEQVVELIKSMGLHMDDLKHPRKRKRVFEYVANDLTGNQIQVTAAMVQSKWHSLLKSYRKAKDNRNKTGRGPSRFHFFDMMDEILASTTESSWSYTINLSKPDASDQQEDTEECFTIKTADEITNVTKPNTPVRYPQKLKREYLLWKHKESLKRQKRHEDKMKLEEAKLELQKKKLAILERYLKINSK